MMWLNRVCLVYLSWFSLFSKRSAAASTAQPESQFDAPSIYLSSNSTSLEWADAAEKASHFVAQLTLEEKAYLVTGQIAITDQCVGNIFGIERLNFTGICLQDGPLGLRNADLASVFPAGVTTAATWDRELFYLRGRAIGQEFRGKGAHVVTGPVAGPLGRHPLGGRNWEGFSPDPYLTGQAMKYTVKGTQEEGVQACAKHFIGNEQETQRSNVIYPDGTEVAAISSNIDDRTLHELYLPPFADAVKAGVATVMCGYNRLNQTYTCQNSKLLNGILKEELGFLGYVVSDFYATHDGVPAIEAGLDMNMPGPWDSMTAATTYLGGNNASLWGQNLTTSVGNGSLSEERLDDMIRRIMTPYFHLGQNEGFPSVDPSGYFITAVTAGYIQTSRGAPPARDVRGDHAKLIRRIGAEATVLLKNVNSTLPLKTPLSIGVFGNDAGLPADGMYVLGDDPPYPGVPRSGYEMGTLSVGGGSGSGRSTYVVSPLNAVMARAKNFGGRVQYILDNALIAKGDFSTLYPTPEVCLVFLKTWCGEGTDRASFENDWNSTLVVERVASHCPNTVVVTHSAGVNTMPWAENENVTAILAAHYPGQESGNSIVDVLFGDINPSGRLPYTIPRREADYALPITNMTGDQSRNASAWQSDFTEGLYIDYRHFDAMNITPLYDFGYGLSYTTFEIVGTPSADLLQKELPPFPPSSQVEPGGNPRLWDEVLEVQTVVRNAGSVAGATVVQLYLGFPMDTVPSETPSNLLKGFEKVYLKPGESEKVSFMLLRRDVSFWNVTAQNWQIPQGEIRLNVGFSSRDKRGAVSVALL